MSVKRAGEPAVVSSMFDQVRGYAKKIGKTAKTTKIATDAFSALGVHQTDTAAMKDMKGRIVTALHSDCLIEPLEHNPTVYFVYKNAQEDLQGGRATSKTKGKHPIEVKRTPVAVFKVGAKPDFSIF